MEKLGRRDPLLVRYFCPWPARRDKEEERDLIYCITLWNQGKACNVNHARELTSYVIK